MLPAVLPVPPLPGLYIIQGPPEIVPWTLKSIALHVSPLPVVCIDAANQFNAHGIAIAAAAIRKDPSVVLRSLSVARPFTSYQLEPMVTQKLLPAVARVRSLFSVITD